METVLCVGTKTIKNTLAQFSGNQVQVFAVEDVNSALEILDRQPVQAILVQLPPFACPAAEWIGRMQAARSAPIVVYEPGGLHHCEVACLPGVIRYIGESVPDAELCGLLLRAAAEQRAVESRRVNPSANWRNLLVGSSNAMREVIETIGLVASVRSTVLITGETGTGKEIAARAIHLASNRAGSRMVAINCAALPDHLLEAELFGHTKGAFTGAVNARVGLFEQAHRSTIFLDEIGEMPLQLQSKLLRVLQEREVQRVGSSETIPVDVRVIAASNQDLAVAVAQRRFREDLLYRLRVVSLRMPLLRERPSDIPELAQHFLRKFSQQEGLPLKQLAPEALRLLVNYSWPGNIRQLEHAIESASALSGPRTILYAADFDLPAEIPTDDLNPLAMLDVPDSGINFEELIAGIERRLLLLALQKSGGNKARAANMLQMKRTTLISKFKSLEVCA